VQPEAVPLPLPPATVVAEFVVSGIFRVIFEQVMFPVLADVMVTFPSF
jgi:hypothetical protein